MRGKSLEGVLEAAAQQSFVMERISILCPVFLPLLGGSEASLGLRTGTRLFALGWSENSGLGRPGTELAVFEWHPERWFLRLESMLRFRFRS